MVTMQNRVQSASSYLTHVFAVIWAAAVLIEAKYERYNDFMLLFRF
jgi:hypothetical protein